MILKEVKQLNFLSNFKKENTGNVKVKLKNFSFITFSPILILINLFLRFITHDIFLLLINCLSMNEGTRFCRQTSLCKI